MTIYTPHFLLDVVTGDTHGKWGSVSKFGHNLDIDKTSAPETIWSQGGLWVAPTAARIHNLTSTSTEDDTGGDGAITISVQGLDENWDAQSETVTLNGTANVPTVNSYRRIFRMQNVTCGVTKVNEGIITATAVTDGTVTAAIPALFGTTFMAVWSVPRLKTACLLAWWASINRQGAAASAMAEMELRVCRGIDTANPATVVIETFALAVDGLNFANVVKALPKTIVGPADIEMRCTYVSDNDTVISGGFDMVYSNTTP